ncbi:MAG TPA: sigma-54 dependent transcriptional regulator [Gemmataceae bacterium]|nr:sigma-54 dependent transcriptional regulator [Gemmataceae bacterium]
MANILLIDDDADLTHFLRQELEADGYRVTCLDRAADAPDLLVGSVFNLVLLDNKMPGMTGIEFLEALQKRSVGVPVILITGYSTFDTAIEAMDLGAYDYVIKPDDYQALVKELRPLIAKTLELTRPVEDVHVAAEAPPAAAGPLLVGRSMVEVGKYIGKFARSDDPVLILGETGTGKELVARAFYTKSPLRRHKPFVPLNCTALNESLLESELFGHEPGAFTGADKLRKGKFEYANGGTLFLDEIGDMPLHLQAKLLRVLEYQQVERVGSNEPIQVNVRILSATHRDLEALIQEGKFRRDLYHRLNRVTVRLPALRDRADDIPELVTYFLTRAAGKANRPRPAMAEEALARLRAYQWPGNVRQLDNVVCRAFGMCRGPQILTEHLDFRSDSPPGPAAAGGQTAAVAGLNAAIEWAWATDQKPLWETLHDLLERELLKVALARANGNQTEAADRLGMARGTVIKRMQKYGLK